MENKFKPNLHLIIYISASFIDTQFKLINKTLIKIKRII